MSIVLKAQRGNSGDPFAGDRLSISPSVGYEIQEFLSWEALLLDSRRYAEWSDLLAHDFAYGCPGRPEEERSHNGTMRLLRARPQAVTLKVLANTRRFLSNVIVAHGACRNEFAVASYVLIHYCRPEDTDTRVLAFGRRDCLLRVPNGFRILRRDIESGRIPIETRELVGPL